MALRKPKNAAHQEVDILVKQEDIAGLVDLLLDEEVKATTCSRAMDALIELNTGDAWEAIASVLAVNETAVVEIILDRLAESKVPGAIRATAQCLSNPNVFVRSQAVRTLSKNFSPAVIPHLLRASRDPEPSIARSGERTLKNRIHRYPAMMTEIRPDTAEGIIEFMDLNWAMEFLSDSFPEHIRIMAARRVGQIGGTEGTQCLASVVQALDGEIAEVCWQALEQCQDIDDFVLLPMLVDPRPEVKARALRVYARIIDEHGADLLEGMAKDAAPEVRMASLEGLTRLKGVGSIQTLYEALKDPEEPVQLCAIRLLTTIEDSSPELVDAVTFFKGEVRRVAMIALANRRIVSDSLTPYYFEFLLKGTTCTDITQTEYLDAINSICKCLSDSGQYDALIAFTALCRSAIRRLRRTAIEAIMKYPAHDRSDALHSLEESEDKDILRNVAFGLDEIKDDRCIMPLIRVAVTIRGRPALRAKEALESYEKINSIEFLLNGLKTRWAAVRKYCAERLRELKDPVSIPGLMDASNDADVEVQLAVIEALGPFAGSEEQVTKRMLEVVAYGDVSVRQAACEALGEARCKEAVPDLVKALHNYFLRPRAEQALKMIGDRKGFLAIKRLERRERLFPKKPRDVILAKKKAAI